MMMLGYSKETTDNVSDALDKVTKAVESHGFKVLNQLDFGQILASKGLEREPIIQLEVCNAQSAFTVLNSNIEIGLLLPCKINIYQKDQKTYISFLDPEMMKEFFKESAIHKVADEVRVSLKTIVDESARP
jgi:uncharacterized protein (DUF302 family)